MGCYPQFSWAGESHFSNPHTMDWAVLWDFWLCAVVSTPVLYLVQSWVLISWFCVSKFQIPTKSTLPGSTIPRATSTLLPDFANLALSFHYMSCIWRFPFIYLRLAQFVCLFVFQFILHFCFSEWNASHLWYTIWVKNYFTIYVYVERKTISSKTDHSQKINK